jgi:hypothetical protein
MTQTTTDTDRFRAAADRLLAGGAALTPDERRDMIALVVRVDHDDPNALASRSDHYVAPLALGALGRRARAAQARGVVVDPRADRAAVVVDPRADEASARLLAAEIRADPEGAALAVEAEQIANRVLAALAAIRGRTDRKPTQRDIERRAVEGMILRAEDPGGDARRRWVEAVAIAISNKLGSK